jgi:1-acyl-sn-glycerol-3-phosphate acyltransferase
MKTATERTEAEEETGERGAQPQRPAVGIIDYLLTVFFTLSFSILLIVWDVVQRIAFYGFGERALHRVDRTLNWLILVLLQITGARFKTVNPFVFPNTESYLVIANHQSMFDISMIHELVWQHTPRFVAKQELGKWIPGISFNLRFGGHPLIDRSNGPEALKEINRFAKRLHDERFAAIIFPEGTRARDGVLKKFKPSGLVALLKHAPNAKIVVVAIDGSWRFQTYNCWPIPKNSEVKIEVIEVLDQSDLGSMREIIETCERLIRDKLNSWRVGGSA